tara:strand:- start:566 stop:1126 length:561 start_codon:yes stop_codon:yes gene_type:complete
MSGTITIALYWILYFYRFLKYWYSRINYKINNKKPLLISVKCLNDTVEEVSEDFSITNYENNNSSELSFIKYTIYSNNLLQKYYKRILNKNDIVDDISIFISNVNILSISVIINDYEYDISISEFNLINNKILDEPFVKWYLNKHYGVLIKDNYKIIVIDNDVNVHKLYNSNYIIICNDTFTIKTI